MSVMEDMIDEMKDKKEAIRSCEDSDELETLKGEFDEMHEAVKREQAVEEAEARREHKSETEDRELNRAFASYLNGEELSGNQREALAIRDDSLRDVAGEDAIRAPGNAFLHEQDTDDAAVRQVDAAVRAPLGQITSDYSEMQPPTPKTGAYMLGLPPAPVFDRATKLPALNGVAIPIVSQTFSDPFAGVTITSGQGEGEDKGETDFNKALEEISTVEYNAHVVISDQALRRIPALDSTVQELFMGALKFEVNGDLVTEAFATDSTEIPRTATGDLEREDLINLETEVPWYWRGAGLEYAMSEGALAALKLKEATNGMPIFAADASQGAYSQFNGYPWFLDELAALGSNGDLQLARWDANMVGVGQDIAFRRSNEGLTLGKANSTAFFCWAHFGFGRPIPELNISLLTTT